jgi:hypothetical protein
MIAEFSLLAKAMDLFRGTAERLSSLGDVQGLPDALDGSFRSFVISHVF